MKEEREIWLFEWILKALDLISYSGRDKTAFVLELKAIIDEYKKKKEMDHESLG